MEVKVIDKGKDGMKVGVYGADHALMNLVREALDKDKDVEFATYSTPHPLLDGFVITVSGKTPEASVIKALAAVKNDAKGIKAAFKKAK